MKRQLAKLQATNLTAQLDMLQHLKRSEVITEMAVYTTQTNKAEEAKHFVEVTLTEGSSNLIGISLHSVVT